MASAGNKVVVWEFNENARWIPYEPNVTQFIEEQLASGATAVRLGEVDPSLNDYIDLVNMEQIEQVSGASTQNRVRIQRSIYLSDSPAARGVMWQWSTDKHGTWKAYDMETASILEKQYHLRPTTSVDLSVTKCGLPYIVDFKRWKQTNIHTTRKRGVQRVKVRPYPKYVKNTRSSPGAAAGHSSSGALTGHKSLSSGLPTTHSASTPNSVNCRAAGLMTKRSAGAVGLSGGQGPSTRKKKSSSTYSHMQPANHQREPTQQNDCDIHKILKKYSNTVKEPPRDEECCICCEKLPVASGYTDSDHSPIVIELKKCKHMFHQACLYAMYKTGVKDCSMQCPICKTIYGQKMGCCPDGTMNTYTMPQSLPGHYGCGTIVIEYSFHPGQQDSRHPHPGHRYYAMGFPRHCFLPDNEDGNKILKLLRKAWDRKLTFTIGTSVTTGQQDTVVWNEIHHKTEFGSNISGHGYPDPNYVKNVLAELAAQGITEDSDDSG